MFPAPEAEALFGSQTRDITGSYNHVTEAVRGSYLLLSICKEDDLHRLIIPIRTAITWAGRRIQGVALTHDGRMPASKLCQTFRSSEDKKEAHRNIEDVIRPLLPETNTLRGY